MNYPVLSGLFLFTAIGAMQTVKSGHFSTGITWVFPMGSKTDSTASATADEVDVYSLAPLSAGAQVLFEDGAEIDGGSCHGLPTVFQVYVVFGFLAAHTFVTTTTMNVLVLTRVVTRDSFAFTNFAMAQIVFFVMVLAAGAGFVKAALLTLSFFVACTLFLMFFLLMLRQQVQLVGVELEHDPEVVFEDE